MLKGEEGRLIIFMVQYLRQRNVGIRSHFNMLYKEIRIQSDQSLLKFFPWNPLITFHTFDHMSSTMELYYSFTSSKCVESINLS